MEEIESSSVFVAPLSITKTKSTATSSKPQLSTLATSYQCNSHVRHDLQMTPPPTPQTLSNAGAERSQFKTYLRAQYAFHPPWDENSTTVTLPLNPGDLVLVYSVHTNGWADGILLISGARGWLPTNYCIPYAHEPMRPVLRALTNFWSTVQQGGREDHDVFSNTDCIRGLVAGVRYLLVCTALLSAWGNGWYLACD